MADEGKNQTNEAQNIESEQEKIEISPLLDRTLPAEAAKGRLVAIPSLSSEQIRAIEDFLDRLGAVNSKFKEMAEEIRSNLMAAFAGTSEDIGAVLSSYQRFLHTYLKLEEAGRLNSQTIGQLTEKLTELRDTVTQTAEAVAKKYKEEENFEEFRTQQLMNYLSYRKTMIQAYYSDITDDIGKSLDTLMRGVLKQSFGSFIAAGKNLMLNTKDVGAALINTANVISRFLDIPYNVIRKWAAATIDAGKSLTGFQMSMLRLGTILKGLSLTVTMVAAHAAQGISILQEYAGAIQNYYRLIARSSDTVITAYASFHAILGMIHYDIEFARRFGLTFSEVFDVMSRVASQFAIHSISAFAGISAPISLLTYRFLQLRLGFEDASTAMDAFVRASVGPVRDAFRTTSTTATDFYRAIAAFAGVRRLVADMGYSATLINNTFIELLNTLRYMNESASQTAQSFAAWIAIFRAVGDTTYMRLDDWVSVLSEFARHLRDASGATRMFYGILMGYRGLEAYWAGGGFRFSGTGFAAISEEGLLSQATRGVFNFIRTAVGPISQVNAIIYESMLKQYLGLGESLAKRFTALLVNNPAIVDILATYGLSERTIGTIASMSGVPRKEIESLYNEVKTSSKSTRELMVSSVNALSNIEKAFKPLNTSLSSINRIISMIFPSLALWVIAGMAKLIGLEGFEQVNLGAYIRFLKETGQVMGEALKAFIGSFKMVLEGAVKMKSPGLEFQEGGIVPGPIGAPRVAVVHGGEAVLPAWLVEQLRAGQPGNIVVHTEIHVDKVEGTDVALDSFAQKVSDYVVKVVKTELAS